MLEITICFKYARFIIPRDAVETGESHKGPSLAAA